LEKALYELFKGSNMVDFIVERYQKINGTEEVPKGNADYHHAFSLNLKYSNLYTISADKQSLLNPLTQ
jgi:hypothetical protein